MACSPQTMQNDYDMFKTTTDFVTVMLAYLYSIRILKNLDSSWSSALKYFTVSKFNSESVAFYTYRASLTACSLKWSALHSVMTSVTIVYTMKHIKFVIKNTKSYLTPIMASMKAISSISGNILNKQYLSIIAKEWAPLLTILMIFPVSLWRCQAKDKLWTCS